MAAPSFQLLRQAGACLQSSSSLPASSTRQPAPLPITTVKQCSSCRQGVRSQMPHPKSPCALPSSSAPYQPLSWDLPEDDLGGGQGVDLGLGSLIAGLREDNAPAKLTTQLKGLQDRLCNSGKPIKPKEAMELTFQLRQYMEQVPAYLAQYQDDEQKQQVQLLQTLVYPSLTQLCQTLSRFCWGMEPIGVSGALSLLRQARKLTWLSYKGMVDVGMSDLANTNQISSAKPMAPTNTPSSSTTVSTQAAAWASDWSKPSATAAAATPPSAAGISAAPPSHTPYRSAGSIGRLQAGSRHRPPSTFGEWNQEAHRAAAVLLPRLRHQTLRLVCQGAMPAYTINSLLAALHGMSMPLTGAQKQVVVAAVVDLLQANVDSVDNMVLLVCMVARVAGVAVVAQHMLPLLTTILEANQKQQRPQMLSFAACAQLVWLMAQVNLLQQPSQQTQQQAPQTKQQQHIVLQQQRQHQKQHQLMLPQASVQQQQQEGQGQKDEAQAAAAAWLEELSVLQGCKQLTVSNAWPVADPDQDWPRIILNEGGQTAFVTVARAGSTEEPPQQAMQPASSKWRARLLAVLQHQVSSACQEVETSREGGIKLQSAGTMVAHWRQAGLPSSPAWASLLANAIQGTLQQSGGAAAKLPLVQLAALPTLATASAQAVNQEMECLGNFAVALCKQIDQIASHVTDVQLHYVVSCMAQLQATHPQLQLLPPMQAPAWLQGISAGASSKEPTQPAAAATTALLSTASGTPILKAQGVQVDTGSGASIAPAEECSRQAELELMQRLGVGWLDALRAYAQTSNSSNPGDAVLTGREQRQQQQQRQQHGQQGQLQEQQPQRRQQQQQRDTQVLAFLQSTEAPWSISNTIAMALYMADAVATEFPDSLAGSAADPTQQPTGAPAKGRGRAGSPADIREWAPFLPQYAAWPILLRLLLRYSMAAATAISDAGSTKVAQVAGYHAPRQTALAAQHLATQGAQSPRLDAQLLISLNGASDATQLNPGLQLVQLLHALSCVPRIARAAMAMEAAALATAIARSVDSMPLYALLAALSCMPRLRLRPNSNSFRGTVQARLARCAEAGELRVPAGSLGVLPRVLDMLRALQQLSLVTGPNLEAALTRELLACHLNGEPQPGAAGQNLAAMRPDLAWGIAHSVRLPAGYLQDKEFVQLMRLMAALPMPGTEPLLRRMEQLLHVMTDSNSMRGKFVAPCIAGMCKLGMRIPPPLLARLLRCGLLTWATASSSSSSSSSSSQPGQQQQPVLQLYHAHAILLALQSVRYPMGSVAAAALTSIWECVETQRMASQAVKDTRTRGGATSQGAWLRAEGQKLMKLLQVLEASSGAATPEHMLLGAPPVRLGLSEQDSDDETADSGGDGPQAVQLASSSSSVGMSHDSLDLDALIGGRLAMLKTAAASGTLPTALPPSSPVARRKVLPIKALPSGSAGSTGKSNRGRRATAARGAEGEGAQSGILRQGETGNSHATVAEGTSQGTPGVDAVVTTSGDVTSSVTTARKAGVKMAGKASRASIQAATKEGRSADGGSGSQAAAKSKRTRAVKSAGGTPVSRE